MTKIKASVTALHPAGTVPDQVVRRAPSMPTSIPPDLEPEYRALMRQLISMPDWNNSRVHLVEAYILALHAMRNGNGMQRITASNAVLRYSRALGIVRRDPVTLRPTPSHPRTLPLFPSSEDGQKSATGASRAPWSRVTGPRTSLAGPHSPAMTVEANAHLAVASIKQTGDPKRGES